MQHARSKPKASAPPTAEQLAYWDWLRERGYCEACGTAHELVIHHILPSSARSHDRVVLLCSPCHNGRSDSVHMLGSEAAFCEKTRIDLVAIAVARLKEYRNDVA